METCGFLEFLGINVYDGLTDTMAFYSTASWLAHFKNLAYDSQSRCMHALFFGEYVELHVILLAVVTVQPDHLHLLFMTLMMLHPLTTNFILAFSACATSRVICQPWC